MTGPKSAGANSAAVNAPGAKTDLGQLLTVAELANYLRVPVQTVYQWRYKGQGPAAIRVGRHLRYQPDDIVRWIERRKGSVGP